MGAEILNIEKLKFEEQLPLISTKLKGLRVY